MPYIVKLMHTLREQLFEEQNRFFLWAPVFLGIGITLYLSLNHEPSTLAGVTSLSISAIVLILSRGHYGMRLVTTAAFLTSLGFSTIQLRSTFFPTPMLEETISKAHLSGTLVEIETMHQKVKLTLQDISYDSSSLPVIKFQKVRLYHSVTKAHPLPQLYPGMRLRVSTSLHPVTPPLLPNGFDFKRKAYFEGISAHGFTEKGTLRIIQSPKSYWSLFDAIQRARRKITEKIHKQLKKSTSPIAAALLTGEKSAISKKDRQAYANSGIAHLLAISGLHLSIVAGFVFITIRVALALIPRISLQFNSKKVAALIAIITTLFYMLISGSAIPSQRSFLMTSIIMLAVMVDRKALSMRSVALAAFGILLLFPHTLVTPSFQLSFAAVVALVAFYEFARPYFRKQQESNGVVKKVYFYITSVLLTSAIATLATTPFTIYHFGQFTLQSLLTNLLAIPLMAFWIMPSGFLSLLFMPLDLHGVFLHIMGMGVECITTLAHTISQWPGALIKTPKPHSFLIGVITMGGLWLCLWKQKWRLLGLIPFTTGVALLFSPMQPMPPNILVSPDGKLIGVYLEDRTLLLSAFRHNRFTREIWESSLAPKRTQLFPYKKTYGNLNCEQRYCLLQVDNKKIAIAQFPSAAKQAHLDNIAVLDAATSTQENNRVNFAGTPISGATLYLKNPPFHRPQNRPWSTPHQQLIVY